jgi:hypothetical protein
MLRIRLHKTAPSGATQSNPRSDNPECEVIFARALRPAILGRRRDCSMDELCGFVQFSQVEDAGG